MMATQSLVYAILLGGILGFVGQGIRVIVGMKKAYDTVNTEGSKLINLFEPKRLLISLLIGFIAGVLASILMNINAMASLSKEIISSLIGAGYAGTDFIEGFMRKSTHVNQQIPNSNIPTA